MDRRNSLESNVSINVGRDKVYQSEYFDDLESPIERTSYIPYVKYILFLNCFVSFVFYGFNATLGVYFQTYFGFDESAAGFLTNAFISLNYLFSLIGGVISDEYLGKQQSLNVSVWIFTFALAIISIFSALSYLVDWLIYGVFIGLFFVCMGNGIIVPCMSAFIGDQFLPHQDVERSNYFSWFYLFTQFGSIVSTFCAPFILDYSATLLFILFLITLVTTSSLFTCFQRKYRRVPPVKGIYKIVLGVLWEGLHFKRRDPADEHWLDKAKKKYKVEDVEDVKVVIRVLQVFVPLPFFWAIYFQIFSLWVFMAEGMNNVLFGYAIPPSSITSLNPLMDLFLIPFFAKAVYPLFRRCGKPISPLQKMSTGLYCTVIALIIAAGVQFALDYFYLSIFWMIPQFFFISCAEITLSVTAIEFAYTQAPERMKSAMTAAWYFTVAIGNLLVALISLINIEKTALELLLFADIIMLISGIFVGIAIRYRYTDSSNPLEK